MGQCNKCGNEAKYLLRCAISKDIKDTYLCESCYTQMYGDASPIGIIGDEVVTKAEDAGAFSKGLVQVLKDTKCPCCHTSLSEVGKTFKFGCEKCYEAFSDLIAVADAQIDSKMRNPALKGDGPEKSEIKEPEVKKAGEKPGEKFAASVQEGRLKILEERLKNAIKKENYEEAAELRDLINTIKEEET